MNASNPWRRKFLRLQAASMMAIVPLLLSVWPQEEKRLSREQLMEDTRQLAATIESAHPDPYINGGGKIAFHRRIHEFLRSIPEEGMSPAEFYTLLRPFVAAIGDAHTSIRLPDSGGDPGLGLPLGWEAVEDRIYVARVYSDEHKPLLGAVLSSVEGVDYPELVERQKKLTAAENEYGNLNNLLTSLGQRRSLEDLVPECEGKNSVDIMFCMPDGSSKQTSIAFIDKLPSQRITPPTQITIPDFDKSDPVYGFLDSSRKVAILRFGNMMGYREAMEYVASVADSKTAAAWINSNYERFNKKKPPQDLNEAITGIPAATETFRSLVSEMKTAGTETLLLDVRGNPGGNSFITDILIYFLFGWKTRDSVCTTVAISKYSELFFTNYKERTIEDFGKDYAFPLVIGDYALPEHRRTDQANQENLDRYATFAAEKRSGAYEEYYRPKNIVVLTSSKTFSSGYWFAADLMKAGAKLIGTPSSQAGNCFGDTLSFVLKNSRLTCSVSYRQFITFPDDPEKGRLLHPDYEMTYDRLASYGFDPNAEVRWALELFPASETR